MINSLYSNNGREGASHKKSKPKGQQNDLDRASNWLKNQPVEFMENKGQMMNSEDKPALNVLFKAEVPGMEIYITKTGISYVFLKYEEVESEKERKREKFDEEDQENVKVSYERIDLDLFGASILKENVLKEDTGIAYYNYIIEKGKTYSHVKKYKKVTIMNVYPGIDWVLYNSSATGFKYDFIAHPGAHVNQIQMVYNSKKELFIDESGNLNIEGMIGKVKEKAPYSYFSETRLKVESRFKLLSSKKKSGRYLTSIGFDIPDVQAVSQTLIIDPQLVWSTFYGGNSYEGTYTVDVDPFGNIFLCGYTNSANFPLQTMGTFFQSTFTSETGFILKFNNTGTLLWSTYFGPASATYLASDHLGNVFLCGTATSTLFPAVNASTYFQGSSGGGIDAFIAKFDNLGSCVWSTFYGGSNTDLATSICTDNLGNAFLIGYTFSTDFPIQNAGTYFEPIISGANSGFVVKFDNSGNRLWATYLKGLKEPVIKSDINENIFITGFANSLIPLYNSGGTSYFQGSISGSTDAFVIKFDNLGNQLLGTYYGGTGADNATSLETDRYGNVFICGVTNSSNFPVQNAGSYYQPTMVGVQNDIFILKFDSMSTRKWATYIGGSRFEYQSEKDNITIDTCGNVFLGFTTQSRNVPLQPACDGGMFDNSIDTSIASNYNNVYLVRFSNNGNLLWSTYFGGDGKSFRSALGADKFGSVFFSGEWNGVVNPATYPLVYPSSPTFTSPFMGFEDLYIAKFTNNLAPQNFSYTNICVSDTNPLPVLASGFLAGGMYSGSPGLNINSYTGQITSSLSTLGTHTVIYHLAPCYCPGAAQVAIGTATVSLLAVPVISIAGQSTICLKESATYTASGASSYTWSNGSNSPTISVIPSTYSPIVYTVSSLANNGCVSKKTIAITVSKCTAIDDIEIDGTKIVIYPNPNSGKFTIYSDANIVLELTNEIGQVMQQIELTEKNERKIEIQNMAEGVYFIKDNNSKQKSNYKIVVSK